MLASVVIPTFRRNAMLERALESVLSQPCDPARHEIVVVDNSPEGGAAPVVQRIAARAPVAVRYDHETSPGISHARNRGIAAARGEHVVFVDDDQEAEPRWLEELLHTRERADADAVFGAVVAVCDGAIPEGMDWALEDLSRDFDDPSGLLSRRRLAYVGTGNSLFRKSALGEAPFAPALGLVGGEDTILVRSLAAQGKRLAWCREARVLEHVPAARLDLATTLRYRFSCGQIRTYACAHGPDGSLAEAALWMLAGAAQAVGNAALATGGLVLGREATQARLGAAARGLGKVLWMEPFLVTRYRRTG